MKPAAWMVAAAVACAGAPRAVADAGPARPPGPRTQVDQWVDSVLATMTLRDRAAQMVWPSTVGDYLAAGDERWSRLVQWIRDDKVGGFTISVGSPFDIAAKLDAMQREAAVPLLFGADFEAGAGFRARGGVFLPNVIELGGATWTPPLMALGAADDTVLARSLGRITAVEGRALGVHIVYGPVLDVNNNAANPVINVRSFGEDPALVARLGAAFVRGVQENGMLATAKHFPGHGDTEVNSHLALPQVDASRARLDSVELVPFRAAVRADVGAVMTFHGALPALDAAGVPATLSPAIIGGLLRRDLGFGGLAITDAMDMRGVLDRFGGVEAAQRAVAAGADILIQPEDVRATIDAIVAGVQQGRYPGERLTESARRILTAKRRLRAGEERFDAERIRRSVGTPAHRALADTIATRSLTLVRDAHDAIPLRARARVVSVTVARRSDLTAGVAFDAGLRAAGHTVRSVFVDADAATPDVFARARAAADSGDAIVIGSYVATRWDASTIQQSSGFVEFVRSLTAVRTRNVTVVAFGNPYLLQQIGDVPSYAAAWSGTSASQAAAARAFAGRAPITGRLPISIPPLARRGAGVTRGVR